ncbi:MAG TPA: GNVR domain-containing protein [Deltaproteobacteria bacterium]|nr:GNVR domain-containing protein [Deltaproteobacteria bacterium]HOS26901.1 GNVR domain-containing protein [Deltaproteobacteria bacterium]HPL86995.1 GNVR domain-containing protein [Deltaproteobacteria bacterium]
MSEQPKQINIQDIIDALLKKWHWVTIPLLIFLFFGAWLYVVLPRKFEATTLILVQPQEIPSVYVAATVSTGIEERLRTLSQEVMSRSNLENIIMEMDLFREERAQGAPMDILVASMRKAIEVSTVGGGRGQTSSFTITYRGQDPWKVAEVTNRLASFFIESHLKLRAKQASETTLFLEKQLNELKILLQQQEDKVKDYRNQFMGELPEQLTSNISTISGLQLRLESVQASLTEALNGRLVLQSQLSQMESNQPGVTFTQRAQRISTLRSQLEEARGRYTPEHPSIKMLEQQIAELESVKEEPGGGMDPHVAELRNQLATANIEIETLKSDANRLKARIDYYQQRVENTPKREQELAALTRDYTITQQNYQRLLDRYYEAQRAESMEKRQQGEQFRIVDYAQPPEIPVSPNKYRVGLIFLALGLGTGAGLIFLLEFMDTSVKGIKQLENWSGGVPCITAVPLALTQIDKQRQKFNTLFSIGVNVFIIIAGTIIVGYSKFNQVILNVPIPLPF